MKILVINPNYLDATSYYRAWGTFKDLSDRYGWEFTLYESTFVPQPSTKQLGAGWADLIKFDVVLFQRALGTQSIQLLNYCKLMGLKIWYDLDDDLWNIPDSYQIKQSFDAKVMQTIEEHIKASDLVTCSTIALADVIREKTGVHAAVVNNAWDFKRYPLQSHNEKGAIIWRGSSTHKEDLRCCRSELESIGKDNKLEFWGYNPISERPLLNIKEYTFVKPLDVMSYFHKIREDKPKAVLVPLQDSKFNQSKSNIAWIEITASGGLCFSNFVGEFKKVGYEFNTIEQLNNKELCIELVAKNQRYLLNHYNLTDSNDKRVELLNRIVL